MGQLPGPEPDFAGLFAEPSIDRMLAPHLTPHQFEHFVKYVFEWAGYFVEDAAGQYGQGIDLRLFTGPAHARMLCAAVSVKQFTPPAQVTGPQVALFQGNLGHIGNVLGYVVTTSDFNKFAKDAASQSPRVWPIDGAHFLRYINYVRGTRAVEAVDTEPDVRLRTNLPAPISPEVLLAADDIARRPVSQTKVLVLANHKGGVGKTTTALNLAAALDAQDQQVLLVDMDAQANLTKDLPPQAPDAAPLHIGDYFTRKHALPALVRQTQFKRVWLIPSSNALIHSDLGIAAGPGAEVRFVRDLHAQAVVPPPNLDTRPFDWILIDTGPSMGLFTRAAVAAAHYVLMPIAPGVFTDLGANLLVETVGAMGALIGNPITILGSLVTQWKDDSINDALLALAKPNLEGTGIPLLEAKIPLDKSNIENAHLEASDGQKKTLFTHHKKSKAAQGYAAASAEVLRHVNAFGKGE